MDFFARTCRGGRARDMGDRALHILHYAECERGSLTLRDSWQRSARSLETWRVYRKSGELVHFKLWVEQEWKHPFKERNSGNIRAWP